MPRDFTLFTGQWADLPLEEVCRLARDFGYDGLELAFGGRRAELHQGAQEVGLGAAVAGLWQQLRHLGRALEGEVPCRVGAGLEADAEVARDRAPPYF